MKKKNEFSIEGHGKDVKMVQSAGKVTESLDMGVINRIEEFITRFATFTDAYQLPIALWTICTYIFPNFDAFPYLVITSDTKRSGKSRTAELISFVCSNPRNFGAMTPSSMFRIIDEVKPTIFFDEAEILSQESAGVMRSVLNMGYRKGSKVPRTIGNDVVEFETYCPKVFILIGDVLDTLRDRSITIRMKRAEARNRFVYESVKSEGEAIRDEIQAVIDSRSSQIVSTFMDFKGIEFLTDRDEEIWSPIFVLASVLCPERMKELERIAVDMATEKTAPQRRYTQLLRDESEGAAMDDEYSYRLLSDLHLVAMGENITSQDAVERLREINTAPWRKYRGEGLTMHNVADMMARFGLKPMTIRFDGHTHKGYKAEHIEKHWQMHCKK